MPPEGLEPSSHRLKGGCSSQLSYGGFAMLGAPPTIRLLAPRTAVSAERGATPTHSCRGTAGRQSVPPGGIEPPLPA